MPPAHSQLPIYVHIILFLFVTTSLASTSLTATSITTLESSPELLLSRATPNCPSSAIPCGAICIPSDYTCCPDHSGGCSASEVCQIGDNEVYGCCPVGEVCVGNGGSQFIDEKIGGDDSDREGEGDGDGDGNGDGGSEGASNGGDRRSVSFAGTVFVVLGTRLLLRFMMHEI